MRDAATIIHPNSTIVAKRIQERYIVFMKEAGFDPDLIVFNNCDLEYWSYIVQFKKFETILLKYVKVPHEKFLSFSHTLRLANLCVNDSRYMPYQTWYIHWLRISSIYNYLINDYLTFPITHDDMSYLINESVNFNKIKAIAIKIKSKMPSDMHTVSMLRRELEAEQYKMQQLLNKITGSKMVVNDDKVNIIDKRNMWELDINNE